MLSRNLYEQRRIHKARLRRIRKVQLLRNIINQTYTKKTSTFDQIVRSIPPQVNTETPLENDFYNGAVFQYHTDVLEPAGWDLSLLP
ncbi:unnamed protein product [Rhizophagus irregularis]|nr:unnamed protein product [Rhizophagus irregularis]